MIFSIEFEKVPIMVIGIWYGDDKPKIHEYFEEFVPEMENLLENGMFVNDHHIKVKFGFVICDSPARAMVKGALIKNLIRIYH